MILYRGGLHSKDDPNQSSVMYYPSLFFGIIGRRGDTALYDMSVKTNEAFAIIISPQENKGLLSHVKLSPIDSFFAVHEMPPLSSNPFQQQDNSQKEPNTYLNCRTDANSYLLADAQKM